MLQVCSFSMFQRDSGLTKSSKILDIDKSLLAKVYESPEVTGTILPEIAEKTGLSTSTVVVGGAGDNAAAAVGTGVVEDGKAFTTIGTSGVVFAHSSKISIDPKGQSSHILLCCSWCMACYGSYAGCRIFTCMVS